MPISEETIRFLIENRLNNSREYYNAHKNEREKLVFEPLKELVSKLTPYALAVDNEFVTEPKICKTIARIVRDTRYTLDKSLYRDNLWIMFNRRRSADVPVPGLYFEFSAQGWDHGCGFRSGDGEIMKILRRLAEDGDPVFLKAKEAYDAQSEYVMMGEKYKRAKFSGDNAEWLNRKTLWFTCHREDMGTLYSEDLYKEIGKGFLALADIYALFLKIYYEMLNEENSQR